MSGPRDRTVAVTRVDALGARTSEDRVVRERPLEIRAGGGDQEPVTLVTTLRTPGHDEDLATGWMVAEGLLGMASAPTELLGFRRGDPIAVRDPDDVLIALLAGPLDPDRVAHRHTMATGSCGLCGRASIPSLIERIGPIGPGDGDRTVAWDVLASLPQRARGAQRTFGSTGGLHATGLFDPLGELLVLREDVGRHNALDAAIGALARSGDRRPPTVALLSGRVGVELVTKAAAAGIPVVAGIGAASDLAIGAADALGLTLVGFLREGTGNIYAHPQRITGLRAGDREDDRWGMEDARRIP